MNSYEKFEKALGMEPYKDRREIPVFPMMLTSYGTFGRVTQKELIQDADTWIGAMDMTFRQIGIPDVALPICAGDAIFAMGLPARRPGVELGDDALYQFIEKPYFKDTAEYKKIYEIGWSAWYYAYMADIQNPKMDLAGVGMRFQQMGANMGKILGYFHSKGIVPIITHAIYPIYDALSLIRSMGEFTYDLYDDPGPIMDIINKYQPVEDEANIRQMKATGAERVWISAMRSSSVFASPDMFREYIWPALKGSILRYHEAGIMPVIHADADWLPMLPYFTELPKGCCHIELDGATDIEKAYEILCGSQSIRGDVPSTLFAYGTPDEVSEYCEKLIEMGMRGGFILGSGCEIPMNSKVENIKAMIDAVR